MVKEKINRKEIAVLTTVANFNLYNKTSHLFPEGIKRYVIDGGNGMYGLYSIFYMFKKLKNRGIKWLIMVDEDIVFVHPNSVFSIIEKMNSNGYIASGVRDGGVINHRAYNPYAINTFFSIINFEKIISFFSKKEIMKSEQIFERKQLSLLYDYDVNSSYEPYYCFYFWLLNKGEKILYLKSDMYGDDGYSNEVYFEEKAFLIHTWFARSYGVNEKHTKRIDDILRNYLDAKFDKDNSEYVLFKDYLFGFKQSLIKTAKKVEAKVNYILK